MRRRGMSRHIFAACKKSPHAESQKPAVIFRPGKWAQIFLFAPAFAGRKCLIVDKRRGRMSSWLFGAVENYERDVPNHVCTAFVPPGRPGKIPLIRLGVQGPGTCGPFACVGWRMRDRSPSSAGHRSRAMAESNWHTAHPIADPLKSARDTRRRCPSLQPIPPVVHTAILNPSSLTVLALTLS